MQLYFTVGDSSRDYSSFISSYYDYNGIKLPIFTQNGVSYVFSAFGNSIPLSDLSHYVLREFKDVIFLSFQHYDTLLPFSYSSSYNGITRLGIEHLGKYCVFSQSALNSFSYSAFFDTLEEAINDVFNRVDSVPSFATTSGYIANSSLPAYPHIFKVNSYSFGDGAVLEGDPQFWGVDINVEFKYFTFYPVLYPSCCSLDYSPIVKLLGGTPA